MTVALTAWRSLTLTLASSDLEVKNAFSPLSSNDLDRLRRIAAAPETPTAETGKKMPGNRRAGLESGKIDDERQKRLSFIKARLKLGQRLSGQEMAFLKQHAPHDYRVAVCAEQARKEYERQLRACRSKEEVTALARRQALVVQLEIHAIDQSNASSAQKTECREAAMIRQAARESCHRDFIARPDFERLPEHDKNRRRETPRGAFVNRYV